MTQLLTFPDGSPRIALVTGGAGGIGSATAMALAAHGARVMVADVTVEGCATVVDDIRGAGGEAESVLLDVGDPASWAAARGAVREAWGSLSILVNNAGIDVVKSVADTTLEDWERLFRVNSTGMFLGTQCFLDDLNDAGTTSGVRSSIVNMSSICGNIGVAFQSTYCATKGAVRMFTKAAAVEFGALGLQVRMNSIHPGTVDTAFAAQCLIELGEAGFAPSPEEARAAIRAAHPIGDMAQGDEIADAIVFLASDLSRFMTGSEMLVDGGYTAQ